ncbi:MAG: type III secretion system inner membrane ring subunit SctD [Deltaproteobacteria bacterium]|nr:type III secretion system inner membrane ring subunit SctD [Deltaproteobacteria bacterium]
MMTEEYTTSFGLEFRVVAGPNLGASIDLTAGQTIWGSGDEADFILSDHTVMATHLELTITESEAGGYEVSAKSLAGPILLDGVLLPPEGGPVAPGQALALGFSALAYRADGDWGAIDLAPRNIPSLWPQTGATPQIAAETPPVAEEGAVNPMASNSQAPSTSSTPTANLGVNFEPDAAPNLAQNQDQNLDLDQDLNPEGAPAAHPPKKSRRVFGVLVAIIAIVLLALLATGPDQEEDAASQLKSFLSAHGYSFLTVRSEAQGLEVAGDLPNDKSLSELVELIKTRPHKTFLRVGVTEDLAQAAQASLVTRGWYPEVSLTKTGRQTRIQLFARDQRAADKARADLALDLPTLKAQWKVVSQAELEPLLRRELNQRGLDLKPIFEAARVDLLAPPNFTGQVETQEVFQDLAQRLGSPIAYSLKEEGPKTASPTVAKAPESEPDALPEQPQVASDLGAKVNDPLANVKIEAVTLFPMRFLITRDGQRLFEGSLLPGGWAIDSIKEETLTLSRAGTEIEYHFKETS